jgi:sugar lactone lactonase YvrE
MLYYPVSNSNQLLSIIASVILILLTASCEQEVAKIDKEDHLMVSTLAGTGSPGFHDGTGGEAKFNYPSGIVIDSTGMIYVADHSNHSIRIISPEGVVSTFAGTGTAGFANGHRSQATFNSPYGLAIDRLGNLYVGDVLNHAIRKISTDGIVTTLAGGEKGFADRSGSVARFDHPHGIAVDAQNNVYVADAYNNRVRKITPEGSVSTFAGNGNDGYVDGNGQTAEFYVPIGIAIDAGGNVYVSDEGNSSIRKITPARDVTTLAGNGRFDFSDGVGKTAEFNAPGGIALDAEANLYITDYFNNCIRKVTPTGVVTKVAGNLRKGFADGASSEAQFYYPFGIAVDRAGVLYVGDQFNHRIRKIN